MKGSLLSRSVRIHTALAHPARLRIVAMLGRAELCACQAAGVPGRTPSTVSAHLEALRAVGLSEEWKGGTGWGAGSRPTPRRSASWKRLE